MALQEIFEKAATHLLTQNAKSFLPEQQEMCAYRGCDGMQCAVGVFIKDEFYSSKLEKLSVDSRPVRLALKLSGFSTNNGEANNLLKSLQEIHDCSNTFNWRHMLRALGESYKLNTDFIKGNLYGQC